MAFAYFSQIEWVAKTVGRRRIDALVLSVGGNDVGFSHILKGMLLANESVSMVERMNGRRGFGNLQPWQQRVAVMEATHTGQWGRIFTRDEECFDCVGLGRLPAAYASLESALRQHLPGGVGRVYIAQYPDLFHTLINGRHHRCTTVLEDTMASRGFLDLAPDLEVGRREIDDIVEHLQPKLNREVFDAASLHGWASFATDEFYTGGHGYCSYPASLRPGEAYYFAMPNPWPEPVPPSPPGASWVRSAQQSVHWQGPLDFQGAPCGGLAGPIRSGCYLTAALTSGTMHPNELGHQGIASALISRTDIGRLVGGEPIDSDSTISQARSGVFVVRDAIHPGWDVDMYEVRSRRSGPIVPSVSGSTGAASRVGNLVAAPRPSGSTTASAPRISNRVQIEITPERPLEPVVRLFDAAGRPLALTLSSPGGATKRYRSEPIPIDLPVYVGVSASVNDQYDPVDNAGHRYGSGGAYQIRLTRE